MVKRESLRKQNVVFSGRIITVRDDEVTGTTGKPERREVVLHGGGVCVVPLDGNDVILVRQYRYAMDAETLEVPAGKLDKGESHLLCGTRELAEEVGASGDMTYLGRVMASPGFCNEIIHIYMAENLTFFPSHPDEGEEVENVRLPLAKALEMVESGEIFDSKTVTGLLLLDRILERRKVKENT